MRYGRLSKMKISSLGVEINRLRYVSSDIYSLVNNE